MKKIRKKLIKIAISVVILIGALILEKTTDFPWYLTILPFILAYYPVGYQVLKKAFHGILSGQVFDENFLMGIATIGAFCVGEYEEAVAVMIFYQIGEVFESYAVNRSRKSIASLMDIRADYANLMVDGKPQKVDPSQVQVGDVILVRPGEKIPLDGVVVTGNSSLDTKALTGESVPRTIREGDSVISGCVNLTGTVEITVAKVFGESTVAKILDLVENASSRKAKSEAFITKFARYYTPAVVISALLLAFIPPIFSGYANFSDWLYRALVFLVISCPCALVISVPMSFFGGLGKASKIGVLVKGSNYLEALAKVETVVFDKTGTLTKGVFQVMEIQPSNMSKEELLKYAAAAELQSNHPIAVSIREAYQDTLEATQVGDVTEIPGHGISATCYGHQVLAGNAKLMERYDIAYTVHEGLGTLVYLAVDGVFAGSILIADEIKPHAKDAIARLKEIGVKNTVMLTGDASHTARVVAEGLGIEQVKAELLPGDKVDAFDQVLNNPNKKGSAVYVGDGINDAPVLALADVGIAMGGLGQDAAIEAADVVIMNDELEKLPEIIKVARKTLVIVTQNIVFALGIKFIVLILGALGYAGMWAAVFADVGVAVIAILNAMRALK